MIDADRTSPPDMGSEGSMGSISIDAVRREVLAALREDLADANVDSLDFGRDLSAQLLGEDVTNEKITAVLKTNSAGVLCGTAWFDVAMNLCSLIERLDWHYRDGDRIEAGAELCTIVGSRGGLLTAERTALNFIQMLSGVATRSRSIADQVDAFYAGVGKNSPLITKILDTRKSIPNLRHAQKYAVKVGGCHNHRFSLNDAVMIKENHIIAAGDILALVHKAIQMHAHKKKDIPIILEVENLQQLEVFLSKLETLPETSPESSPESSMNSDKQEQTPEQTEERCIDVIMLDNFSIPMIKEAVAMRQQLIKDKSPGNTEVMPEYEMSGGVTPANLEDYLALGVERISMGYLTKDYAALDFSLRFSEA
ncbi:MAG: nicotinate-nucleotide diphosphorylase [Candidatus Portiera sp.]|nr:nicotinate-nucleotide diphosphorylase [Portiera sp.]